MRHTLIITTVLLAVSLASANPGWVSSAGIIKDAYNPWFLPNTKTVNYCIQIDETNLGQSLPFVQNAIRNSFDFWKKQFKDVRPPIHNSESIRLATQNFVEVPCSNDSLRDPNIDLVFQFGYLTPEQENFLTAPQKLFGVAVRTDYHPVNLKGRGFIYFSPQSGPLAMKFPEIHFRPWSDFEGVFLYMTIIHEIGHIFGLQHDSKVLFMGSTFIESLLINPQVETSAHFLTPMMNTNFNEIDLFTFNNLPLGFNMMCVSTDGPQPTPVTPKGMNQGGSYGRFFGLPFDDRFCIGYELKNDVFYLHFGRTLETLSVIGSAKLTKQENFINTQEVVTLWLPEGKRITIAAMPDIVSFKGTYQSTDGRITRKFFLEGISMVIRKLGGIMDGEIHLDLMNER